MSIDWDKFRNTEMSPKLHAFPSKIPFSECDSPSRRNMVFSQISQHVTIEGSTTPRILSGSEREYADWTHGIRMPCNGVIRRVINKHQPQRGRDAVNVTTVLIYEDLDDPGYFGLIEIPHYFTLHYQFGFKYKRTAALNEVRVGKTMLAKGTPLAQSPAIDKFGNAQLGTELNAVFMTRYEGIEDGCGICEDVLDKFTTRCYQTISVGFGKNAFPLNMFGTDDKYQPFPNIGQYVDSDCLIMALRRSDPILNAVNTDPSSLRELDHMDTPYVSAQPNARIIDIDVIRTNVRNSSMLTGMDDQLEFYADRTRTFYQSIWREYQEIKREVKNPRLDPEFNIHVRYAQMLMENQKPKTSQILARPKTPLDEFLVTFKLEYLLSASDASKATDLHGGKFVFTKILKPEQMPVDEYGIRSDIILLDEASSNRMNVGRDIEQAVGAVCIRTEKRWKEDYPDGKLSDDEVQQEFSTICKLYDAVDPAFHANVLATAKPRKHVEGMMDTQIHLGRMYDTGRPAVEVLEKLDESFDIEGTRVTFTNFDGEVVTTVNKALIAPLRFVLLDKVADVAAATSSARMQHFNTPANLSSSDKVTTPYRDHATRIMGEVEGMMVVGTTEEGTYAETLDQTTNAISHTEVCFSLLEADNPMDVEKAVNRDEIPLTGGRPQAVLSHMIHCSGLELVYKGEE